MDQVDIDDIVEVPDTPDRLAALVTREGSGVKDENHSSSMHSQLIEKKLFEEGTRNHPMVIDSGSKRPSMRLPKSSRCSDNSVQPNKTKGVTEKKPSHKSRDSLHTPHINIEEPSCSSKSSSHNDKFVELAEMKMHRPVFRNAFVSGVGGSTKVEFRERPGLPNGVSCANGLRKKLTLLRNAGEGTDNNNNMSTVGSTAGCSKGVEFAGNVQNKCGNSDFLHRDPVASPRLNKQKRLVRNGCISPNNVAKSRQLYEKDTTSSVPAFNTNTNSSSTTTNNKNYNVSITSRETPASVDIMDLVAEDNSSYKGKGKAVLSPPCSSKETGFTNKHSPSRSSISFTEKATETNDYSRRVDKNIEESSGWISTYNRPPQINLTSPIENQFLIRETEAPGLAGQHHEQRVRRRGNGISVATSVDYSEDPNLICSEQSHSQRLRQSESNTGSRLGRLRSAASTVARRHRQGPTLSSFGECSSESVSNEPEIVFLGSSAEPSTSRSISNGVNNFQPVIEVNDFSPELRCGASEEDARARQLEADENLARELQEQLYNEVPVLGAGGFDAQIALGLEHYGDSGHVAATRATHPTRRGAPASTLRRQYQSRTSLSPRRGSQVRAASALGRMTRMRDRFPRQPRTVLPSRGRASMFPADMDIDMRIHILGTMEAFSDMGVGPPSFFQAQGDFNENDYEMLLALDENNDQHSGASVRQINNLPQSTVQSDNYQEPCAVCLDTPTIGDTIRHLPCLHKFHKDCIDPWLRRKTSCPICKSSIT